MKEVTAVIVNFQTPELLENAVLANFKAARENGYKLLHFPMDKYIDHLWRGTASKYGYKLGLKGKLDYLLNRLGL